MADTLTTEERVALAGMLRTQMMLQTSYTFDETPYHVKAKRFSTLLAIAAKSGIEVEPQYDGTVVFTVPGYVAPDTVSARDLEPGMTIVRFDAPYEVVSVHTSTGSVTTTEVVDSRGQSYTFRLFAGDPIEVASNAKETSNA